MEALFFWPHKSNKMLLIKIILKVEMMTESYDMKIEIDIKVIIMAM